MLGKNDYRSNLRYARHLLMCLVASWVALSGRAQDLRLELVRTFSGHQFGIRKVVFSPDAKRFASGGTRGEIYLWDVATGAMLKDLRGHMASVADLRFSKDGRYLISGADDGQVIVWDLTTSKAIDKAFNPPDANGQVQVRFALITDDNERIFYAGHDQRLFMRTIGKQGEVAYTDRTEQMRCAQLSPDGTRLMVGAGKLLLLFNPSTGKLIKEFNTGDCVINAIQYSADGSRVITWCENARVDMRDPNSMILRTSFRSGSGNRKFSNLDFTKDQRYIVTGDHAARFNMWDLEKRTIALDQSSDQGTVLDFDICANPTMLLSGSMDRSIKLWKITDALLVDEKGKKRPQEPSPDQKIEVITYEEPKAEAPKPIAAVQAPTPQPVPAKEEPVAAPVAQVQPQQKEAAIAIPQPTSVPTSEAKKEESAPLKDAEKPQVTEPQGSATATVVQKQPVPVAKPLPKPEPTKEPVKEAARPVDQRAVQSVSAQTNKAVAQDPRQPVHHAAVASTIDSTGRKLSILPERFQGRRVPPVRTDHRLYFMKPDLEIAVWDAQVIDGDIVSLYMDDKLILADHALTEGKKYLRFDGTGYKRCFLFLHAHNLGTIPPSTVTMTITDGNKSYQIEVRSDLTMSSGVELNFE